MMVLIYRAISRTRTNLIPLEHLKDPDAARSAKRVHVKRGTGMTNKTTTQRYVTASINVGLIIYEHAWPGISVKWKELFL